jgi:hypothetical protein
VEARLAKGGFLSRIHVLGPDMVHAIIMIIVMVLHAPGRRPQGIGGRPVQSGAARLMRGITRTRLPQNTRAAVIGAT